MNKISLIIKREYSTRVKKKSFIIMTLLMPILMAALFILPAYFAAMDDTEVRNIAVYDGSSIFSAVLKVQNSQNTILFLKKSIRN